MTGIYGNSMEDRYFARQLNVYLDSTCPAEVREQAIADRVDELMEPAGGYCPYIPDHMREAINECPDADMMFLALYFGGIHASREAQGSAHPFLREQALNHFDRIVRTYWVSLARDQAEREIL